jgi:hypothetical protein
MITTLSRIEIRTDRPHQGLTVVFDGMVFGIGKVGKEWYFNAIGQPPRYLAGVRTEWTEALQRALKRIESGEFRSQRIDEDDGA